MNTVKAEQLVKKIHEISRHEVNLMEFCGTHTHEIFRYGIRELLPENIKLLSGPGCPVCVTAQEDIDYMIELLNHGYSIITFGDLINVPGRRGSLSYQKAIGKDVRVLYSPIDALKFVDEDKKFVFIGIGFETTAPMVAYLIKKIKELNAKNFFFFSIHKLTPPAMKAILDLGEVNLNGIIGPGHVSTIIGRQGWEELFSRYPIPFAISGFEPIDILTGIYALVEMIEGDRKELINVYTRNVKEEGNLQAKRFMSEIFRVKDANWRGLGILKDSGLKLREEFQEFDIEKVEHPVFETLQNEGCRCGEVLRGIILPENCPLFRNICNPDNPKGPCMVSSEGTCRAYYLYGER